MENTSTEQDLVVPQELSVEDNNSLKFINDKIVNVAKKRAEEQLIRVENFHDKTKAFIHTETINAYAFVEAHFMITNLTNKLMEKLTPGLVEVLGQLNHSYNEFYTAFCKNLGCWSAICDSQRDVLPRCVAKQDVFRQLCKMIKAVVEKKSAKMDHIIEKLRDASSTMGTEIFKMIAAANYSEGKSQEEIQNLEIESQSIRKELNISLDDYYGSVNEKVYCEMTRTETEKQRAYLECRKKSILEELDQVVHEINSHDKMVVTEIDDYKFVNKWKKQFLEDKKEAWRVILEKNKGALQKQLEDIKQDLANFKVDNIDLYEERINQKKKIVEHNRKKYENISEILEKKKATFLESVLRKQNIPSIHARQMSYLLSLLSMTLIKITTISSSLDTTQAIINEAISDESMEPAIILTSISSIFKYTVMSEIINGGTLQTSSYKSFNDSYISFFQERQRIQIKTIESAPAEKVEKNDKIALKKKLEASESVW